MEQKHKNILQTSFAYLIKNLHNVEDICDHLVSDDILTSGMMDTIKHKKPKPTGQTRELLSILPRRGKKAYDSFLKALSQEASANEEVADYLRGKDGSKSAEQNGQRDDDLKKRKGDDDKIQKTSTEHSQNPDEKKKNETGNSKQAVQGHDEDWPDLENRLKIVKKSDIQMCTKELYEKICKGKQVYHMTSERKGKFLSISNVQCIKPNTDEKSLDNTQSKETNDPQSKEADHPPTTETDQPQSMKTDNPQQDATDCGAKCRSCVDFDKTAILQLFKHMQYESKGADVIKDVSADDMKTFLKEHLQNKENSSFDSLVVVIFSGGDKFKSGQIYDKDSNKIDNKEIFSIIEESPAFAGKPKIVIIRTYNFEEEDAENFDVLDAEKQELHFYDKEPNNKDLFVVSSQPRTKRGPWIIGDGMNGSYFIQAFIDVFRKMAHEKSLLEMMTEVNNCLIKAMVPVNKTSRVKEAVAEVMILEHSVKKELFFFPGLTFKTAWPDLKAGASALKKKDVKLCSPNFYEKITKERKIYPMTSVKRGKFILISNAQCNSQCEENQSEEDMKKKKARYEECVRNSDFDKSNMTQLFKFIGYDTTGGILIKKKKEEIKEILKKKLNDIDSDKTLMYDSLVVMFLSGKFDCEAGKIYDCDGEVVPRKEILEIINDCNYFKEKAKVVFVQSYNFQEEQSYDSTDSVTNDIIKYGESNTNGVFVVSSYPRIEQGPWMIGENMSGSYFIQALIHVFKKSACEKSLMELLKEANTCLLQAMVPNKELKTEVKTRVAEIVLLEYCDGKELFFFPGLDLKPQNFSSSMSGNPVCIPSN